VCQTATHHFSSQPNLSFLKDVPHPTTGSTDKSAGSTDAVTGSTDGGAASSTEGDWISKAASVDLVWLYFALYKHYHHGK
jgi:hypothetical protein